MTSSEPNILEEKPWFFIRIYNWLTTSINETAHWLFPGRRIFSENEAGNLMRRTLAQKSLIDTLSSGWVELSTWRKVFIVTGTTLIMGLIGIFASAPLFCALSALFICISAHILFVSHEAHRWDAAKLMAEETIALNKELKANKELFDNGVKIVNEVAEQIEEHTESLKEQATIVEEAAEIVQQNTEKLTECVEEVNEVAQDLIGHAQNLGNALDSTAGTLTKINEVLDSAIQPIESLSETAKQFGEAAQGINSSQQEYSEHVKKFGLFVADRMQKQRQEWEQEQKKKQEQLCSPAPDLSAEDDDKEIDELLETLHHNEALFEEMMASMMEQQTYSMR